MQQRLVFGMCREQLGPHPSPFDSMNSYEIQATCSPKEGSESSNRGPQGSEPQGSKGSLKPLKAKPYPGHSQGPSSEQVIATIQPTPGDCYRESKRVRK